jgi:preprotein translocase subunit SecG
MTTIHTLVLIAHVLIGAAIIGLVLLQRGKGAETGAAFGGGASGTVFGARGSANFLSRSTAVLAALFFVTSLSLAYLGSERPVEQSLLDVVPAEAGAPAADQAPSVAAPVVTDGAPALPAAPDAGAAEAPPVPSAPSPAPEEAGP